MEYRNQTQQRSKVVRRLKMKMNVEPRQAEVKITREKYKKVDGVQRFG